MKLNFLKIFYLLSLISLIIIMYCQVISSSIFFGIHFGPIGYGIIIFGGLFAIINNFICVIILFLRKTEYLYKYMVGIKFGLIPYWIINFISLIPVALAGTLAGFIMPLGLLTIPILIFISYIVLLYTSLSSILFLIHIKKNKLINLPMFILHFLLQICFCWDIISTIILVIKYSKVKKLT